MHSLLALLLAKLFKQVLHIVLLVLLPPVAAGGPAAATLLLVLLALLPIFAATLMLTTLCRMRAPGLLLLLLPPALLKIGVLPLSTTLLAPFLVDTVVESPLPARTTNCIASSFRHPV